MKTELTKKLISALKASDHKTSGYDTAATVRRIEDGIAWVHIPGGVDETPVKLTINASVGDNVQVRVSGGRAFLVGNGSAPPTDDTIANRANATANKAHRTALQASEEATEAWHYAGTAAQAAISAQTSADSASQAAERAWDHADDAHQAAYYAQESANQARASAISANNSANNALVQLSVVEDVAGTLRWISEHGDYVLTTDTTVRSDTVYFIYQNGDYVPIANPPAGSNPAALGWYILDVTQAQADYIMSHLAVTSAGLWVLPVDGFAPHFLYDSNNNLLVDSNDIPIVDATFEPDKASGYKVLLSGGGGQTGDFPIGLTIYNDEGEAVANYGTTTTIGAASGKHIYIDTDSVDIMNAQNLLATFGQETAIFSTDGTELAHFGYGSGTSASGTAVAPYYTLGVRTANSTVGNYSLVGGNNNTASGYASVAMGAYSVATDNYAMALGYETQANDLLGVALGLGTVADSGMQVAMGFYNESDPDNTYSLIIGDGTSDSNRHNALTIDRRGNISCGSIDSGIYQNVSAAANDVTDVNITFNHPFTSAPVVTASFWSTSSAAEMGYLTLAVHSVTTSGFTARIFSKDTQSRAPYISWIAILS